MAGAAVALAVCSTTSNLYAQTRTWDGGGAVGSDGWGTAANWDNNALPETTANVVFGSAFTSGTSIDLGGNRTVNSLTISTTTSFSLDGNDTLTLTSGQLTRSAATGSHTINNSITIGAAGVFDVTGTLTINGAISDGTSSFGLTKSGAGILVLSGTAENYNGDTTINAGILRLGTSDQLADGSGDGNLVIGASGTFDLAGFSETVNGLSGSGIVDKTTTGTTTLTVGGNNASATFSGTITDTSGTLNLTKTGSGTQILSGTNSYAGATTITGGVLRIDAAGSLGGGNLNLNGGVLGLAAGDFTRALGTGANQVQWGGSGGFAAYGADRTVNLGGAGATLSTGGSFFGGSSGDELILGATNATHTLTFANGINFATGSNARVIRVENGAANIDAVISGNIGGTSTGWDKEGAGTLRLTGNNTYALGTTINGGKLLVDGTHTATGTNDDYTVAAGATLGGAGTINIGTDNITLSGSSGNRAVLNPGGNASGDGIATLSVTGNLIFAGNSRYAVEVNGGSADRLTITGNLDLDNATSEDLVINATAPTLGKYTLVSYTGTLASNQSFSTVTGIPTNYRVINNTAGKTIDLQHKADQTFTFSAPSTPIDALVNTIVSFSGSLNNTAIADSSDLVAGLSSTGTLVVNGFSAGNVAAGGSGAVTANLNTGATAGASKPWQVTNTDANAVTTTASVSGAINVYDHASGSLSASSLVIPDVIVGYGSAVSSTGTLNVNNASGFRVNLQTTNDGPLNSVSLANASGVAAGGSQAVGAQLATGKAAGAYSENFTVTFADHTALSGASSNLGTSSVSVTGNVFDHANASFAAADTNSLTIDFNAIYGTIEQGDGGGSLTSGFDVRNLASIVGAALTADLDLDSVVVDSATDITKLSANLSSFAGLAANGLQSFLATLDTNTVGTFSTQYTISLSDEDLAGALNQSLTLNLTGTVVAVPEPTSLGLVGVIAVGMLARRRRRH